MDARWVVRAIDPALSEALARELSMSSAACAVLVARGVTVAEQARAFLTPRLDDLHDPFLFKGMEKAARRVLQAVMRREKILIYGDYDVDGISSTALLYSLLKMVDARVSYHVPDRLSEGYGMKPARLLEAAREDVRLVVTVDCGISSVEEVRRAAGLGMDVVVTDHHEPAGTLPEAVAVINPKVAGSAYPFRELAGVGVAFKLAWAIAQSFSPSRKVSQEFRTFLLESLALVALGTIADVVPLTGENRVFVKYGLKALESTVNPGLRALLDETGLAGRRLRTSHVAFRIAPRLNAAGRMGRADLGMQLLTTGSMQEAARVAAELERENRHRQRIESEIFSDAMEKAAASGRAQDRVVVLARDGWHPGVTGIVASKLAEELRRPVILIALDGEIGKGSARSVADVHIYELLRNCSEKLIGFGGHAFAAGFEIHARDIEVFRMQMECHARQVVCEEVLRQRLEVDFCAPLENLTVGAVRELGRLEPYGEGNPEPVFASEGVVVAGKPHLVGRDGKHLSMLLRSGDAVFRAVGFGLGRILDRLGDLRDVSVAYVPFISSWGGTDTVELELRDLAGNGRSLVYEDKSGGRGK